MRKEVGGTHFCVSNDDGLSFWRALIRTNSHTRLTDKFIILFCAHTQSLKCFFFSFSFLPKFSSADGACTRSLCMARKTHQTLLEPEPDGCTFPPTIGSFCSSTARDEMYRIEDNTSRRMIFMFLYM